jgi:hypothetical protein
MPKDVIKDIIEAMPYRMRKKAEQSYERYKAEKRETLSPEVVERLYFQVLNEAKERGK